MARDVTGLWEHDYLDQMARDGDDTLQMIKPCAESSVRGIGSTVRAAAAAPTLGKGHESGDAASGNLNAAGAILAGSLNAVDAAHDHVGVVGKLKC